MKLLRHTIFILTVSLGLPIMLIARDKGSRDGSKDHLTVQYKISTDSIPSEAEEAYQDKGPKGKRPKGGNSDQPGDRLKPTIKEVPRSIPKLKPKTVTDRI